MNAHGGDTAAGSPTTIHNERVLSWQLYARLALSHHRRDEEIHNSGKQQRNKVEDDEVGYEEDTVLFARQAEIAQLKGWVVGVGDD